ncbi:MAG: ABC transporter permease [Desulfitobacteriaceae bacterium]|jgi:D-methionine transport system permease protein|nr:ABC transporter permease [Desulfitobacteriaceae bacterium]
MESFFSPEIYDSFIKIIWPALGATFRMLIVSAGFSTIFGFVLAIVLIVTDTRGLYPNPLLYKFLDFIINTIRSFPFIILLVAIIPFTRMIVGTSIGEQAAIVPLTISATPFIARIFEGSLREVDPQIIEAAKSFGASESQIVFKVIVVEALPSMVSGIILAVISILGGTAMAGVVGAGGLGAVALLYGYQSFNTEIMVVTVILLIIIVQVIQTTGNFVYKKLR